MNIKKGDTVVILSGKDKDKKGKVSKVFPERGKLIVEGLNVAKRHQKPTQKFPGGIIDKSMPLTASKVMLVCSRCSKPTRIGTKEVGDRRVRVCKKCNEIVDKV
ncbi:50S ribosomal protein L24 [candidate division WOR-1 bacterium RIFOXYB2_FULL_48_7]|uniref:Large ribosomal subunit protein uL24 n=1 Tax=candidate division WOR-1 bacterium RIFOXYB2_FULL_48_7 TaxID=1802583 RepID=A0A1F4TP96_UNCSA|nr:MAG: 50S ribosomal protein L24 [candidate division WOR-1 bacterium RIFOXYB2_FULL_48_7]